MSLIFTINVIADDFDVDGSGSDIDGSGSGSGPISGSSLLAPGDVDSEL